MNPKLQQTAQRIDAMSLRERSMLLAILLLLIWGAWQSLLMAPLSKERKAQTQQLETLTGEVAALNQAVQTMAVEAGKDPQAEARLKLEVLARQQEDVDRQLAAATSSLIAPREMNALLESMLARQPGVTLRALHSLVPEPIDLGAETGIAPLYRHGMTVEVEGSYLDLLGFLRTLEAMPWQFIWHEVQIEHEEHPRSRMRLTLYTMSLSEGWLGV